VLLSSVGLSNLVSRTRLCLVVFWDSGRKYFERKFTVPIHPPLVTVFGPSETFLQNLYFVLRNQWSSNTYITAAMYSFIVSLEDGKRSKDRQKKKQLFKEKKWNLIISIDN
jgi:hypothetical protein